jgi:hypothetical protein
MRRANNLLLLAGVLAGGPALAETVLLDFGNAESFRGVSVPIPDGNGNHWNSVRPGQFVSGLVDIDGATTGLRYGPGAHPTDSYNGPAGATDGGITETMLLTLNMDWQALGNIGVPEAVVDFHVGKLGDPSGYFQIQGLNPAGRYTLRLLGSHKYNAHDFTRVNVYSDSDRLQLLASGDLLVGVGANHNTDTVLELADLQPSADGILYLEFGGADGVSSGYLNCMEISSTGGGGPVDPDPDPESDTGIKLVVVGSSVATGAIILGSPSYYHDFDQDQDDTGWGGSENRYALYGWAGRLREQMTQPERPRVPGGSTTDWQLINVSVPGDTTGLVRARFEPDVTRQYAAPLTAFSEPDIVMISLSLANEGLVFASDPQVPWRSFRDGMQALVEMCTERGYYPVISYVYPHRLYDPAKYALVKEMNLLMASWGVTAINFLGALDNGFGQWAEGFITDDGHPNFIGHEEMYYAIPPTLFDAIAKDGKVQVPAFATGDGFQRLQGEAAGAHFLEFVPDHAMRAFTMSMEVRADGDGIIAEIPQATRQLALIDFGAASELDGTPTPGIDPFGQTWNNWHPVQGGEPVPAGTRLEALQTTDGSATGIAMEVLNAFTGVNGRRNGGLFGERAPQVELLGNLAVETATEDYFFTTQTGSFKLTGLDPDKHYTFRFFGSRENDQQRITRYRVTGTTATVSYSPYADIPTSGPASAKTAGDTGNDHAIGLISGIQPRPNGEVIIEVLPHAGGFGYLASMEISVTDSAEDRSVRLERRGQTLVYVNAQGQEMTVPYTAAEGEWMSLALSHRYAQQETLLFVDGALAASQREHGAPAAFVFGSRDGAAAAALDLRHLLLSRAAWTPEEALAQSEGQLQHASLEVYAPLQESAPPNGEAALNHAQSRSRLIYHYQRPVASYWADAQSLPGSPEIKSTPIGHLADAHWPWIYHFGQQAWLWIHALPAGPSDPFWAYRPKDESWLWMAGPSVAWYYDLARSDWFSL